VTSSYRFAAPFIVRMTGVGLVAVGVLVLVLAGLVAALSLPEAVLSAGLLVAVELCLVVLAGLAALRRRDVVRLDETGYRVRYVRGAGVRQAPWKDVEDVTAPTVEGQRCVVLRLRDGRTTTMPVDVLAGSADAFVRDLQQHLNRGHGYRRLPPRAGA
jgi:hypothetical protein